MPLLIFLMLTMAFAIAEEDTSGTEFQQMLSGFGNLHTVAGNYARNTRNGHNWLASMEGANASAADLSRPHMAMADAAGNVYIADKEGHAIRKVDILGKITTVAGISSSNEAQAMGDGADNGIATSLRLNLPNGLYTLPDGTTYIVDLANNKIRKLTPDGMMVTVLKDTSAGGLGAGRGIWVSPDQGVIFYTVGSVVKRWTATEGIEIWATGFSDLCNIAVDPTDGSLVVTDRVLHRVYRIMETGMPPYVGTTNPIAGSGSTGRGVSGIPATSCALEKVRGIAFRPDGTYFVASQESGRIWFVDSTDMISLVVDGNDNHRTYSGDGQRVTTPGLKISEPRAVSLAPNGDLLITENDRGIIRRVTNICVPPLIINFQGRTLEWQSHREGSYRVEYSGNLMDWTPLSTVDGSNGLTTSASDPTSAAKRFYRVTEATN